MKERAMEIKVGMLVLASAALTLAFIFFLGNVQMEDTYSYRVDYRSAVGLKAGAPVKVAGVPAGKVRAILYRGEAAVSGDPRSPLVRVEVAVGADFARTLHQDSRFYISTLGVLGEKYIEVDPGTQGKLQVGAVVRGEDPMRLEIVSADMNAVVGTVRALVDGNKDRLQGMLENADQVLTETHEMVGGARTGVDRALRRLDGISENAEALLQAFRRAAGDGAEMEAAVADATVAIHNLRVITEEAKRQSPALMRDASQSLRDLRELLSTVDTLSDEGKGKIIKSWGKIEEIVTSLHIVARDMEDGRGLVGALLQDPELYDDLKELVHDLKRHPWKVLWKE